jgi:hypothetical protein
MNSLENQSEFSGPDRHIDSTFSDDCRHRCGGRALQALPPDENCAVGARRWQDHCGQYPQRQKQASVAGLSRNKSEGTSGALPLAPDRPPSRLLLSGAALLANIEPGHSINLSQPGDRIR